MMDAKQQQILQSTCQILQYQQQGLKFCIAIKGSLFLLNLCFVIQFFTNINLKCQAIGISILLTYFIAINYNFQDPFMTYFQHKSTKLQKMFVAMTILLILQVKYISFITPTICLVCYAYYIYQIIYGIPNQLGEYSFSSLFLSLVVVIQWEVIVLRMQEYIDYDWSILIGVIAVGMIFLLFPMGMLTLYMLCATPRQAEHDYEYQESNWYKNHQKQTFYSIFIVYLGYLSIFVAILQVYINQEVYNFILATVFGLTIIEMLLYTFCYKRLVVMFLGYDKFAERIVIRLKNGQFRSIDEISQRQYIKDQDISMQTCYFCDKQANVVHKSCGNITLCLACFQWQVINKKRNCFKCKGYSYNYEYYYICSRQKLRTNQKKSISHIGDYLGQGEYISVLL